MTKTSKNLYVCAMAAAFLLPLTFLRAEEKEKISPNAKAHVCESGEDKRVVEIKDREGGGCKVIYTRGGEAQEVGAAAHATEVCDQILEKIIKNLEGAKFQCS